MLTELKVSLSYLLTPWNRVLLEMLTGFQLVKKLPAFCGTRRFITAFTSARHLSLSWVSSIPNLMSLFSLLRSHQSINTGPRLTFWLFHNMIHFNGEELLAPRPTPKPEDHTLSAVRKKVSLSLNLKCFEVCHPRCAVDTIGRCFVVLNHNSLYYGTMRPILSSNYMFRPCFWSSSG
jgi:hypothetical protein